MSLKRRLATAIVTVIITLPAFADDRSPWSNLGRVEQGARIGIILSDQKRIEGQFQGFTDSDISLRTDQVITLARDNVVRVYRRPRLNRTKRALIGAAIGVVAGVLLTKTAGDRFRNEGQDVPAASWIGGAAGIGAGIGAITGGGYQTVYRR
jgi:hypothetical protein